MKALKLLTFVLTFVVFGVVSSNAAVSCAKSTINETSVVIENSDLNFLNVKPLNIFKESKLFDKDSGIMLLIKVILCFLLPPLAVFLEVGIGIQFWLNLLLTILGWLPGTIHALLVVLGII